MIVKSIDPYGVNKVRWQMDFIENRPGLSVLVAFVLGLIIGLVVLGWGVWPVEYIDAAPQHLRQDDRANYLRTISELYALDGQADKVRQTLAPWPASEAAYAICQLWQGSTDQADQGRLESLAIQVNGQACTNVLAAGEPATADAGGSNITSLLLLGLLFLILIGAILYVLQRRNALLMETESVASGRFVPDTQPTISSDSEEVNTVPLARFQSNYTLGRDNYDDSFSIENSSGDFLGECGVGISESIGTELPKNVTAFEVWLFDKNDIRTVTKVIMSDHAFFDDAIRAKLAPKGEPMLARENEVVVLETATLIVNAEIKDMSYGSGTLPPQSYFDNFTVELSAWAKEVDVPEADIAGRVDELLDY